MSEKNFRICLSAPLGARNGTIMLRYSGGRADGWLNVMNEKNKFSGTISDDGRLTLSGTIRTLMSTVHYTATGTVSGRLILLNLKTDTGAYYPIFGEEIDTDE